MAGAFEIVMQERKTLVDKIISMMKQGDFFHNASEWDRAALRPQNPLSKVWYRGGNRMKLMAVVTERGYRDPRWATAKQLFEKGYHIKAGEHGTICEKWIFEKEKKTKDEHGNTVREVVQLDRPQVMYFRVFNGEQVEGFPEYVPSALDENRSPLGDMIDQMNYPVLNTAIPAKRKPRVRSMETVSPETRKPLHDICVFIGCVQPCSLSIYRFQTVVDFPHRYRFCRVCIFDIDVVAVIGDTVKDRFSLGVCTSQRLIPTLFKDLRTKNGG